MIAVLGGKARGARLSAAPDVEAPASGSERPATGAEGAAKAALIKWPARNAVKPFPETGSKGSKPAGSSPSLVDREETLTLARNGDAAAFARLIRQHQAMVFSLALHALRNRTAAEDLAQEVFLDLYRHLARIESSAHATAWLRRVTSHRCIDEIRRRRHRPELSVDVLPERGVAPPAREFFIEERLQSLLGTLPPRARMVVVLRFQEELEPSEIAEALNMPVNTVKSHLRRSIDVLRVRLSQRNAAPASARDRDSEEGR
jgi:RNA polymerase sigma-70 factor (ECF subfamily)